LEARKEKDGLRLEVGGRKGKGRIEVGGRERKKNYGYGIPFSI
jgi:hypothetical protein